ncbi:hypothetical protein K457DRAFT_135010 [Linnemannia elongata AG-77]|uniref:Uncharacterized protein n=1 Tax=Linnemannia elongata AG-77 TaxID=1314771 RepID=A0A197K6X5_9FUNG|nr:hypothetical protein K457DRAFT_135010 [Linnemannia elongata AG-77]
MARLPHRGLERLFFCSIVALCSRDVTQQESFINQVTLVSVLSDLPLSFVPHATNRKQKQQQQQKALRYKSAPARRYASLFLLFPFPLFF